VKIPFTKMSGAGNDFVVIDDRSNIVQDVPGLARKLCDRRWGVGGDGLLLIQRAQDVAYRMMYYNADGSYGGMCGNGGRCIARYAVEAGIAQASHEFEALGYHYRSVVELDSVDLSMKNPSDLRMNIVLRIGSVTIRCHFINTGSPHVVTPIAQFRSRYKTLSQMPVELLGRKIRYHRAFQPDGTNVNFVQKGRDNIVQMRTYERGVEAETLACGTGSIASAVIGARLWKMASPVTILPSSGIKLEVAFRREGAEFVDIKLKGPAVTTFRGEIDV
jgi:diaminopimelate epimerase